MRIDKSGCVVFMQHSRSALDCTFGALLSVQLSGMGETAARLLCARLGGVVTHLLGCGLLGSGCSGCRVFVGVGELFG